MLNSAEYAYQSQEMCTGTYFFLDFIVVVIRTHTKNYL